MPSWPPSATASSPPTERTGLHESPEAYGFDALVGLCAGEGSAAPVGHKVIVRVDLDSLLRGQVAEGETCEVAGVPVAVSAVTDILASGSAFLAAVVEHAEQLVGVVHLGRRPTAAQQTGLEWLYPTCAAEGCSSVAWLENDHRVDWAASHGTILDRLDRLCSHHHDLKSLDGWGLVDGHGKRAFVAPDDPRHPRRADRAA
jgi:hypothetical protein